jgi:hypothetical protein
MKGHQALFVRRLALAAIFLVRPLFAQDQGALTRLPNGKLLGTIPGNPRQINNLPTAAAISPDGRFAVFLHSGYGAYTSGAIPVCSESGDRRIERFS